MSFVSFERHKKRALVKLENAKQLNEVDAGIVGLVNLINSDNGLFTSSSCYGRIYFINLPNYSKKDSSFVGKWHRKVNYKEVKSVFDIAEGNIWFRMEPFILHVSCKDMETAEKVLKVKSKAGIKRGGIFHIQKNRIQIELEGTNKIDAPVKNNEVKISNKYLNYLVNDANEKFGLNEEKVKKLEVEFRKIIKS